MMAGLPASRAVASTRLVHRPRSGRRLPRRIDRPRRKAGKNLANFLIRDLTEV
jgi:hypothetical protein